MERSPHRRQPPRCRLGGLGHGGPSGLGMMLGKVMVSRMESAGLPVSPSRHAALAVGIRNSPSGFSVPLGDGWKLVARRSESESWGEVVTMFMSASGKWLPQDLPAGSPAVSVVQRGMDPSGASDEYHYLSRTVHVSLGKRWDPSSLLPAETCWRDTGRVWWERRFSNDLPRDRWANAPALSSYWPSGAIQMIKYAFPDDLSKISPLTPHYAEFYPDGSRAVEVLGSGEVVGYCPSGEPRRVEMGDTGPGRECRGVFMASTPVDFDSSSRSPSTAFLDCFPDGAYRVHRCLSVEGSSLPRPWSGSSAGRIPAIGRSAKQAPSCP